MRGGGRMRYPILNELKTSKTNIDIFRGYNHNLRIGDGEFYGMENLTSANYPVLSPRLKRGVYATPENPQGLIAKDALCYVDGTNFVINEYTIDLGLSTEEANCPKQLISMGAYVIILPDKKYINTADLTDYGSIEAEVTTTSTVSFELCKVDGSLYNTPVASPTAPESATNMDLWIDTSSVPHTLKQYSESGSTWISIASTYIRITATGIGKNFNQYDGVTISGVEAENLQDLNNTMVIWDRGDDYIVVIGILDAVTTQDAPLTITRKMPNMDFVIESENRLWGCRYGTALNGDIVNEIYASKLGDFKNWHCYMGLSTDSYAVTVGTDGQFTGAITHLGYPLFFKENHLHKIYGNYPANYQIQTTACRGVQKGSDRSLAIVNEVLYYKSRSAVCAYDGSLPVEISSAFGEEQYYNAVAGANHNKYYISMKDREGKYHLFVYDAAKGLWHREDNTQATAFCSCDGEMYFINAKDKSIMTVNGSGTPETKSVKWMAETGVIGTDMPDKKYISRLNIRMSLCLGTRVHVFAQYDSIGDWYPLFQMTGTTLRTFTIPVRPKRCDHMRLRFVGEGDAKIFSITKTIEQGSDD